MTLGGVYALKRIPSETTSVAVKDRLAAERTDRWGSTRIVDPMTPNRSLTAITALAVGGLLLVASLVLGMSPLLGGGENCAASPPAELGEGSFSATVSVSLIPYGASCAFEIYETGAVLSPGPSPMWTIGIVAGLFLVSGAIVALTRDSVRAGRSRGTANQDAHG